MRLARRFWTQPRSIFRELLAVDDSAHAVAAGSALGIFIGLTPTVGIQMILVAFVAFFSRGPLYFNRTAALLMVYITNPLTIVPIYWFNYGIGAALVGGSATRSELAAAVSYESFSGWVDSIRTLFLSIGWPLLIGSLVVATFGATVTYPAIRWLVRSLRTDEDDVATPTQSESAADDLNKSTTIESDAA